MPVFEAILILLLCATMLSAVARRIRIPYPALLAVGGAILAFVPGAPRIDLPPELILVLFVAPVLLDAAYDVSLRDLRANWVHVSSLILVAVGLTTACVAVVAHHLFPTIPWAAAIALGAIVAPPDAVAALAVLRQVKPPHQIRIILEGESLLNDASALLIYRLAVGAAMAGHFTLSDALPAFAGVVFGSVIAGWVLAWPIGHIAARIDNAPESVVFQFVMTFASWLLAERLGLSGVVTVVVLGVTLARKPAAVLSARIRLSSFAIWETMTMVLNVLAFVLIGLALGPLLRRVDAAERLDMILGGFAILVTVIVVRLVWVFIYDAALRSLAPRVVSDAMRPNAKGGLIVGWSGMRGIVTLATALALPAAFPFRDFIQVSAFIVVFGTLLLQGLTLLPLISLLRRPEENVVDAEIGAARQVALKAGLTEINGDSSAAARRLREEYDEALSCAEGEGDPSERSDNVLRMRMVGAARHAIEALRRSGSIGDDAYRHVEEELDRRELTALPTEEKPS